MDMEKIPPDFPKTKRETYLKNHMETTRENGKLMLFAGDQKVEHLKDDFYREGVPEDDANPEHHFEIAQKQR